MTFLYLWIFLGKAITERVDFYVVSNEDWKQLVTERCGKEKSKYSDIYIRNQVLVNPNVGEGKKPYLGFDIKPSSLQEYKDRWDKILFLVDPLETEDTK